MRFSICAAVILLPLPHCSKRTGECFNISSTHAGIAAASNVALDNIMLFEKAAKIFSVNGREMMDGRVAVFALGSRVNHSCFPNCLAADGRVVALRTIQATEECTVSYLTDTALLLPARVRRELLHQHWHFVCTCERCSPSPREGRDEPTPFPVSVSTPAPAPTAPAVDCADAVSPRRTEPTAGTQSPLLTLDARDHLNFLAYLLGVTRPAALLSDLSSPDGEGGEGEGEGVQRSAVLLSTFLSELCDAFDERVAHCTDGAPFPPLLTPSWRCLSESIIREVETRSRAEPDHTRHQASPFSHSEVSDDVMLCQQLRDWARLLLSVLLGFARYQDRTLDPEAHLSLLSSATARLQAAIRAQCGLLVSIPTFDEVLGHALSGRWNGGALLQTGRVKLALEAYERAQSAYAWLCGEDCEYVESVQRVVSQLRAQEARRGTKRGLVDNTK
eukprot:m.68164 g.68164  ORF g.68164 m.68164 type:complete len:446 (+) comp12756_c0_seq1:460-1797(+)